MRMPPRLTDASEHRRRHDLGVAPHTVYPARQPPPGSRRGRRMSRSAMVTLRSRPAARQRPNDVDVGVDGLARPPRASRMPRMPALPRADDVVRQAVADHRPRRAARTPISSERRLEDARMRLHEAVLGRRDRRPRSARRARSATGTTRGSGASSRSGRAGRRGRAAPASASGTSSYREKWWCCGPVVVDLAGDRVHAGAACRPSAR